MQSKTNNKGFTLVELLVVISVIGTLGTAVVLFLNPDELFKQSRDSSRSSDMATLNKAVALYLTQAITVDLNAGANNGDCANVQYVFGEITTNSFLNGGPPNLPQRTITIKPLAVNSQKVDGTGWVPIDFTQTLEGLSPIRVLPVDPSNDGNPTTPKDARYRYACKMENTTIQYEINSQLESKRYRDTVDRDGKDGGDNSNFYEVGTNLSL